MRFALMIEPQQDVSWEQNLAIAQRAEAAGFETLYRSDHYQSFPGDAGKRSTDAWATIAALVRETTTLRHGTMVSPITFRHPGNLAKLVATIDEMSGGRVELGIGAGWHSVEHSRHAFDFPDRLDRIEMMEEQFQIVSGLWAENDGWSFEGKHYQVEDKVFAPRPMQQPRPPLIMGTKGVNRGLRTAAKWADHLNLFAVDPVAAADGFARFGPICDAEGRDRAEVTTSVLCAVAIGADRAEADRRATAAAETMDNGSVSEWRAASDPSWAIGTPDEAIGRIREFADAGAELIIMQDFLPSDLDHIDLLGALAKEWTS